VRRVDRRTAVLVVAILASSIGYIDSTALTVALPSIRTHGDAQSQWIIQSYLLPLAALIGLGGALGDRFGRRRMLALGTWIFILASIGCALAPGAAVLIATRFVQGAGAALMIPESLALITAAYEDPAEFGRATGLWASASAATMAAGPLLAGWLTPYSWRLVFCINIPLGAAVLVLAYLRVPESRKAVQRGRLDLLGAAAMTAALSLIVAGLMAMSRSVRPEAVAALLAGLLLLAVFVAVERKAEDPVIPLRLFAIRRFAVANIYTLFFYAALGGVLVFVPFELQRVMHYSSPDAGLALLPAIGIIAFCSPTAGLLSGRFGARPFLILGAAISAAGYALFVLLGTHAAFMTAVLPAMLVLGAGVALAAAPLTAATMSAAGADDLGAASGISNSVSRIGNLVGLAALGIAMAMDGGHALPAPSHHAGFRDAMLCAAALALAAALVAVFLPPARKREASALRRNPGEQAEATV